MLKLVGTLLLAVGVMVAAGAGIRFGGSEYALVVRDARATLLQEPDIDLAPTQAGARVRDWFDAAGGQFLLGMVLLVAGAITARVGISRERDGHGAAAEDDFETSLRGVREAVESLAEKLGREEASESKNELERISNELVTPLIESRGVLQRRYGMAGYAAVLGPLSGAERLLNRTWSTLVDGHAEATRESLAGAAAELAAALEALRGLEQESSAAARDAGG